MGTREARDADTKQANGAGLGAIVYRRKAENEASKFANKIFEDFDKISDHSSTYLDQEPDMTKDFAGSHITSSQPINIPRLKVTRVETIAEEDPQYCYVNTTSSSPSNSVGDSVYESPKLPRPSNDFNHVMIKLSNEIKRAQSCCDVTESGSECESCSDNYSASLPTRGAPRRRTVRFDEATITVTAELGESAARFRSQWRKRRAANNCNRFGESRNITVQHEEGEVPSPQLERANRNGKSIFDVCNYSSYGRYT